MSRMDERSRAKLWLAMVETVGRQFPATGYIDRETLEVVLLAADTPGASIGLVADERRVVSGPARWLRIPRFDGGARERYGALRCETLAAFAQDFFDAHDLPILVRPPTDRAWQSQPCDTSVRPNVR